MLYAPLAAAAAAASYEAQRRTAEWRVIMLNSQRIELIRRERFNNCRFECLERQANCADRIAERPSIERWNNLEQV